MVGENFEIYALKMAKMHLKSSTMIGENFKIYAAEMAPPWDFGPEMYIHSK